METLPNRKNVGYWMILFFYVCLFIPTSSASSDYWPTAGWRESTPEEQGMHSEKLNELIDKVLRERYNIDSITIIRNGYMVLDAFFYPFKKDSKHIIHSCTKSITSAAIGIAVDKGYIKNLQQHVLEIFPEKLFTNLGDNKKSITLKNLLTMTSGLETEDSYIKTGRITWL